MPTYICTAQDGSLTTDQKARIAAEITRVHNEVTGAEISLSEGRRLPPAKCGYTVIFGRVEASRIRLDCCSIYSVASVESRVCRKSMCGSI